MGEVVPTAHANHHGTAEAFHDLRFDKASAMDGAMGPLCGPTGGMPREKDGFGGMHLDKLILQGLLDVKYMEDRYLRGKKYCSDFMETRHKLMCFSSLNLGHAAIVSMQSEMGPDTHLGCKCPEWKASLFQRDCPTNF